MKLLDLDPYTLILPPLIGGVIGWFTNAVAIWMLFHPYKRWYVFKFRLPFTPGLIPSRIEELADSIAKIIAKYLLTQEDWISLIDSLELDDKAVDELFSKLKSTSGIRILKFVPFSTLKEIIKEVIRSELRRIIRKQLRKIVIKASEQKNIEESLERLVKEKIISEFKPDKIEKIVRQLCKTELNYIMLFGALLGGLIGAVQSLLLG